jgi:uncharacterized membrane protein YkoI
MNAWKMSAGIGAALVVGTLSTLCAGEAADKLRAAPSAVQLSVIQLVGTNKISDFDTEADGGKTVYDLEYTIKGGDYEADIDPSGKILTREVEVDLSIVPPAVTDAAKKAHGDGKLSEASIVAADGKLYYELDVQVGKDEHEMQIGADGAVIGDSVEAPEAPETPEAGEKSEKGGGDHEDKD